MCFYAHSLRIQSKCTPIAFDAALPKCKPRCKHPGSPGCIYTRILGAFRKCAEMRLKCVMKCSILDLATSATGALCIRCIRPLMQKCADNAAEMHTHAHKMRTKCVRKNETKSSQKPPHTQPERRPPSHLLTSTYITFGIRVALSVRKNHGGSTARVSERQRPAAVSRGPALRRRLRGFSQGVTGVEQA